MKWLLFYVSCLNCRHFQPSPLDSKFNDMGKCMLYPRIIEKKVIYPYAEKVRQDESKCGVKGKSWEKDVALG